MTGRIYEYFISIKLKMFPFFSLYFWKSKPPVHSSTRPHKLVSVCGMSVPTCAFVLVLLPSNFMKQSISMNSAQTSSFIDAAFKKSERKSLSTDRQRKEYIEISLRLMHIGPSFKQFHAFPPSLLLLFRFLRKRSGVCCSLSIDRIIFHVISHCLIVSQVSLDFLDRFSVHKNIYDEAKVCRWDVGVNDVTAIEGGGLTSELSSALKTFRLSLEHS